MSERVKEVVKPGFRVSGKVSIMVNIDWSVVEFVNNLGYDTPQERVDAYYAFIEARENIAQQQRDHESPAEEKSYSFTGLGLKCKPL